MTPLAVAVSNHTNFATTGWVAFLVGIVFGLVVGIYLHKR